MKNFLVIGLGEFGKSVAKTLYKNKATVLAIDSREELIKQALDEGIIDEAVILDATDELALKDVVRDDFETAFVRTIKRSSLASFMLGSGVTFIFPSECFTARILIS